MDQLFTTPNLIYWLLLALVIALQTITLGAILRQREATRWTIGYATVFMLGLPLVLLGLWDAATYVSLFVAVGVSGAVKTGIQQLTDAARANTLRQRANAISEFKEYSDATHPWQR
jgi:post-segregation antitoxin (ccd killing protein)